jgi:hypothetical protein
MKITYLKVLKGKKVLKRGDLGQILWITRNSSHYVAPAGASGPIQARMKPGRRAGESRN